MTSDDFEAQPPSAAATIIVGRIKRMIPQFSLTQCQPAIAGISPRRLFASANDLLIRAGQAKDVRLIKLAGDGDCQWVNENLYYA